MPRIVGGTLGGRRFDAPPGKGTRPTSERVREALASALMSRDAFHGAVLDLFAGSGALGLEALSRGGERLVLVERDRRVVALLKKTVRALGIEDRARVLPLDLEARGAAAKVAAQGPFSLVFADPPYARADALPGLFEALHDAGAFAPNALVVAEHAESAAPGPWPAFLASVGAYRYGPTALAMLRVGEGAP
ncbi:MAG: 16S rRNA (guanine(966)-N(2))-methyltransferase RsmD [Myxococcota bacterium]